MGKFFKTVRMCACLICASTFGRYVHNRYDGFDYAVYRWGGRTWAIPRTTIAED